MHLQVASPARLVRTPCVVQQLTSSDDSAGIFHQLLQNQELLVWQVNRCSSNKKPVPIEVQLHVTDP